MEFGIMVSWKRDFQQQWHLICPPFLMTLNFDSSLKSVNVSSYLRYKPMINRLFDDLDWIWKALYDSGGQWIREKWNLFWEVTNCTYQLLHCVATCMSSLLLGPKVLMLYRNVIGVVLMWGRVFLKNFSNWKVHCI